MPATRKDLPWEEATGNCNIDAQARLKSAVDGARPFSRSEAEAFDAELRAACEREARLSAEPRGGLELRRASFEKWRLIHEWTRHHAYRDSLRDKRPQQWRAALDRLRILREGELIDWLTLQIEVATNLDRGVQDMRPRDPGPTWLVTLDYVANRKRKALAVLHWAEAAERDGCFTVDSEWRAKTAAILGREPTAFERGDGGHEGPPFIVER